MSALAIVFGTALSYPLAYVIGVPFLVPILNTLPSFPFMYTALKRGDLGLAIARMVLWAATMGVCATAMAYAASARTDHLFLNGLNYRQEMFNWILTGVGAEGSPRIFLPSHALHASIFCVLSLLTGSVLSMPMGAILMNYMGHYVGALTAVSVHPVHALLFAWNPWSLVRIVSFVALGVTLAGPVLSRIGGFGFSLREHRGVLIAAACGLLLDVVAKAVMAPTWQLMLRRAAGW
jgi:hypothetical protein